MWGFLNLIPVIPGFIFVAKNWEYRRTLFFQYLFTLIALIAIIVTAYSVEVLPIRYSGSDAAQPAGAPVGAPPEMMNPGQMAPPGSSAPPGG